MDAARWRARRPASIVAREEIRNPIPGNFLRMGRGKAEEEKREPGAHGNALMIAREPPLRGESDRWAGTMPAVMPEGRQAPTHE